MRLAHMFVELILQGYLALCEFRPMAGELSFEHALGTRGTLSLDRDGSEPACHTKKWTLHNEFHSSIHGSCVKFPGTQNSRVQERNSVSSNFSARFHKKFLSSTVSAQTPAAFLLR
jgi:hypothetical protein